MPANEIAARAAPGAPLEAIRIPCYLTFIALALFGAYGCGLPALSPAERIDPGATAALVREVKEFGKTLGIEPTAALSRTNEQTTELSMLWLWLQRVGTLALDMPIDIRMAVGLSSVKERVKVEQVYRVEGYSVYYRQGNEFADARSLATPSFAEEGVVRQVKVILHEDLHGDANFDLPWEIEEGIVTPLASLAALEFFRRKGDEENARRAAGELDNERRLSRELSELIGQAVNLFKSRAPAEANREILDLMPNYPTYWRQFQRQTQGQHPGTVLEAKLSHDAAYLRNFLRITDLAERAGSLAPLLEDLKKLPKDATVETVEARLRELDLRYSSAAR